MDVVDELFDDVALDVAPAPRPSRFQPRIEGKGKVKMEPSRPQLKSLVPKPLPHAAESSKLDRIQPSKDASLPYSAVGNGTTAAEMEAGSSSMDIEEEEDMVVQEFDVYINPSLDADTKLYDMQYPLRPSWRPYELDERCQEIRIMPKQSHFEIELSLDADNYENYDKQVDDSSMLTTQILSSDLSPANDFAVGFLSGNRFHVFPLHSVVRFLPLVAHVDGFQKVKQGGHHLESKITPVEFDKKESVEVPDNKGKSTHEDANAVNKQINISDPWVLLEYRSIESPASCFYKEKAVAGETNHVPFAMKSSDYLSSYRMASSGSIRKASCPSIKYLLTMPLEHRLKQWLSEGPQVNRFDALLHLAPTDSAEDVLRLLQLHAYLVQGLWVSRSSLLCHGDAALYRDYILLQFSKNRAVHEGKLKVVKTDFRQRLLKPLALERPLFKDWKFKEDPDFLFIKYHPEIVKAQEQAWSIREKKILECLPSSGKPISLMFKNSINFGTSSKTIGSIEPSRNEERINVNSSVATTNPTKGQDALANAIMELIRLHKVLSLNSIIQGLQEKTNAGSAEIEIVAGHIATKVHDVYVLKSSGKPALDQFRNVVIHYLKGKGRNAKIKKQEIKIAARLDLKKDVSDADYSLVMNELCISSGGSWVLKSGALI